MEVVSIVQSGIQATGSKLNVQWVKKGVKVKLIMERSAQNAGTVDRIKGVTRKRNSMEESGRYFGKISGRGNSLWIVTIRRLKV